MIGELAEVLGGFVAGAWRRLRRPPIISGPMGPQTTPVNVTREWPAWICKPCAMGDHEGCKGCRCQHGGLR